VLALYDRATRIPLVGRGVFSLAVGARAPYFLSVQPSVLELRYVAKATSTVTAIAGTDPGDWAEPGEVPVHVHAVRRDGETVVEGIIRVHTSLKK
jgi:hypothetical protein